MINLGFFLRFFCESGPCFLLLPKIAVRPRKACESIQYATCSTRVFTLPVYVEAAAVQVVQLVEPS